MNVKTVVVHYGDNAPLLRCLESLKNTTELSNIIISNNNLEPLKPQLPEQYTDIYIIENKNNLGYAKGMNTGIKYALSFNPKYILIITADTTYDSSFLEKLITYGEKENKDIIGPTIQDTKGRLWFQGGEIDKNRYTAGHTPGRVDFIPGCCKLIKKEVFDKIGFLDENYFMYYEDVDFDLRARRANFHIGIANTITIRHDTRHTQAREKNMQYYLARNHLYFVWKLAPQKVRIREILRLPKTVIEHYTRKEFDALAGIKDFFLRRFGKR